MVHVFKEMLEKGSIVAKSLPTSARGSVQQIQNWDSIAIQKNDIEPLKSFDRRANLKYKQPD